MITGKIEDTANGKELVLRLPIAAVLMPAKSGRSLIVAQTQDPGEEIEAEVNRQKVFVRCHATIRIR